MMKIDTKISTNYLIESGEPWIGEIPSTWELIPAKRIFKEISVKNKPEEILLSATQDKGVIPRDLLEDRVMMPMGELNGFKLVEEKDFVISLRSFQGGIEYSNYRGIVSPAYTVLRSICPINEKYFSYLLKSYSFILELNKAITGIRDGKNISFKEFRKIILPFPSRPEQDAIVKYLDEKITDINNFISAKQKLITLLNEQKAAIINKALSKGINADVKMKDSCIAWLGQIPEDWRIEKIKYNAKIVLGKMLQNNQSNKNEYFKPYLRSANIQWGKVDISDVYNMWFSESEMKTLRLNRNDLLVSEGGDIGRTSIWEEDSDECYIQNSVHKITLNKNNNYKFFYYQFFLMNKTGYFNSIINKVSIGHLTREKIINVKFVIPPLNEQNQIVEYIDEKIKELEKIEKIFNVEIEYSKQYKNSIIAEAVTGKIKFTANIYEIKTPKNPYYARTVLAAEIISQLYKEPTFGHIKFVKLLFLAEKLAHLDIKTKYYRQAAGPYDNVALRSIDKQLEEHKWFKAVNENGRVFYQALEYAGQHSQKFQEYYGDKRGNIFLIINTFRTANSVQCEIVATLYSAWEDLLKNNPSVSDDEIVNEVLNNWHESKKRIPKERWLKALGWMKVKNIVPS